VKNLFLACVTILALTSVHACAEDARLDDVVLSKVDLNGNTFGEAVIKFNAMLREKPHDLAPFTVILNLKGLTEAQITTEMNRKIKEFPAVENIPADEALDVVVQRMNCSITFRNHDVILTPTPPYVDEDAKVQELFFGQSQAHPHN